MSAGRGVPGVPVTDGLDVVLTGTEGEFELISDSSRPYVYISVPDGYAISRGPSGAARFYEPLGLCSAHDGDDVTAVFSLEAVEGPMEHHTMVMLADPQMADSTDLARFRRESLPELVAFGQSRTDGETFLVTCGDLVFDNLALFGEYERDMSAIGLPYFQVPGNHDLNMIASANMDAKAAYTLRFGPTYYSFDRGGIHYVCLDNVYWEGGGFYGFIDPVQLGWLAADLARVEAGSTVVLIQHIPMLGTRHSRYGMESPSETRSVVNREEVYSLLEPFRVHVLAGHVHEAEHLLMGRVEEHQNGAVCGAFWTGPVCADGTPNGYVIYEARGEELSWQFKASGMASDRQMSLYGRDSDPALPPGAIMANVWFWDPTWSVRWFEDGEPRGPMTRRTGLDPLAKALYQGATRPSRFPFVESRRTDHLFHAVPSDGASEVWVEAEDRFGRVFSRRLRLDDPRDDREELTSRNP